MFMFSTRAIVPGTGKKVWALAFLNYRSSINIANIQPRKRDCVTQLLFLSFPHKLVLSISHKIILP